MLVQDGFLYLIVTRHKLTVYRECDEDRSNEAAMSKGGRAAPRFASWWAQKDGCAQRTGAHARPKPTSNTIISCVEVSCGASIRQRAVGVFFMPRDQQTNRNMATQFIINMDKKINIYYWLIIKKEDFRNAVVSSWHHQVRWWSKSKSIRKTSRRKLAGNACVLPSDGKIKTNHYFDKKTVWAIFLQASS